MNAAILRVDVDILKQALMLPSDVCIADARVCDDAYMCGRLNIMLKLVGPEFPMQKPGEKLPEVQAVYETTPYGFGVFKGLEPVHA